MIKRSRYFRLTLVFFALVSLSSCASVVQWVGIKFLYRRAPLATEQIQRDISYWTDATPDPSPERHSLNLYLPAGQNWPVMIFVPGGGWTTEDKDLKAGGKDVYGNIGRFFAARSIGVAVVNYQLLPNVKWPEQIIDVARAVAWIHKNISRYGGDPKKIFISGHSAGAQLATRVALDKKPLAHFGLNPHLFCGVIPVSGAGLDLTDAKTYELGADPNYYIKRFQDGDTSGAWKTLISPMRFVRRDAPPFLILYAAGEMPALHRQSELLQEKLTNAGASTRLVVVPGENHLRIVLTLSRKDKAATPAMLDFMRGTECSSW